MSQIGFSLRYLRDRLLDPAGRRRAVFDRCCLFPLLTRQAIQSTSEFKDLLRLRFVAVHVKRKIRLLFPLLRKDLLESGAGNPGEVIPPRGLGSHQCQVGTPLGGALADSGRAFGLPCSPSSVRSRTLLPVVEEAPSFARRAKREVYVWSPSAPGGDRGLGLRHLGHRRLGAGADHSDPAAAD